MGAGLRDSVQYAWVEMGIYVLGEKLAQLGHVEHPGGWELAGRHVISVRHNGRCAWRREERAIQPVKDKREKRFVGEC